jgi:hypothetical protein
MKAADRQNAEFMLHNAQTSKDFAGSIGLL